MTACTAKTAPTPCRRGRERRVDGGNGNDNLVGDQGLDWLSGGAKNDTLWGAACQDKYTYQDASNYLYGNEGDDNLYGGNGYDYMDGGSGNDGLFGGNEGRSTHDRRAQRRPVPAPGRPAERQHQLRDRRVDPAGLHRGGRQPAFLNGKRDGPHSRPRRRRTPPRTGRTPTFSGRTRYWPCCTARGTEPGS